MRRANAIISALIIVCFIIHMIWGGFILLGILSGGSPVLSCVTIAMEILLLIHIIIGIKLTADSVRASRRAGVFYLKENRLFLIRRISGFALLVFVMIHIIIFEGSDTAGGYRLNVFGVPQLISQILMVLSLIVHLVANITPLRIGLGIKDGKNLRTDIMLALTALLFLAGIAFVIYFIRWQVV